MQLRDIPLPVSNLVEEAAFRKSRCNSKGLIERSACHFDSERVVEHQQRFSNGSDNPLQSNQSGQSLICGCREFPQGGQHPCIFTVELPALVMGDNPKGAHCFPADVKWDQQGLGDAWLDIGKISEMTVQTRHQLHLVCIQYGSARAEIAWGCAPKMRRILARYSVPSKDLAAV